MRLPYQIAETLRRTSAKGFLRLINRIGTWTVGLGLAVILTAFMIFRGFEKEVQERLFLFSSHLTILQYNITETLTSAPIPRAPQLLKRLQTFPNIKSIQDYTFKNGLMQSSEGFSGVLLKGLNLESNHANLKERLKIGTLLQKQETAKYSKDLLISRYLADRLNLDTGQLVKVFFMDKKPRLRKLKIAGIYQSYIEEYDRNIAFCDNDFLYHLNGWGDSLIGGYEIYLQDFENLETDYNMIYPYIDYNTQLVKVTERASHYFEWFNLLNNNVYILLTVILIVVFFNNMAVMSILIINMTQTIGLLKALGSSDGFIQQIFFWIGGRLVLKGLLIGNILALALGYFQTQFELISLDPQNYFLDVVPILFDFQIIIAVNGFMLALLILTLLFSTLLVLAIKPIAALRFA